LISLISIPSAEAQALAAKALSILCLPRSCKITVTLLSKIFKLGEIAHLREIASPDIAIVTNTLDAHIGEFGGFNNLVKAKGEIYSNHSKNIDLICLFQLVFFLNPV
jgi:UDP-N-acetylmuramyl pentapeptide synthase